MLLQPENQFSFSWIFQVTALAYSIAYLKDKMSDRIVTELHIFIKSVYRNSLWNPKEKILEILFV